ncbi:MAG TPA: ATP-binding protein [Anaerolineae bacterium]|nr:ATP-binding protein [Anaerolineae bacterium]
MIVLAILNARSTRAALTADARQALFSTATETAEAIDSFILNASNQVAIEAQIPIMADYLEGSPIQRQALERDITDLITVLSRKDPDITSYALLDIQGQNIIDTDPNSVGIDESQRDYFTYFQSSINRHSYVSPVEFSLTTNEPSLYFSHPIYNEENLQIGLLRIRYHARILQFIIEDKNDIAGPGSFGVLFDDYHLHLAHGLAPQRNYRPITPLTPFEQEELRASRRLPDLPEAELNALNLTELKENLNNYTNQQFFAATDVASGNQLNQAAIAQLRTQQWLIIFFQPQTIYLGPVRAQTQTAITVASIIAIATLIFAYVIAQQLARPIIKLTDTVTRFTAGDLDARADINTQDEIGLLADSFNQMASQVGQFILDISRLNTIIETTSDFVALISLENNLLYINPAGRDMIGYPDKPIEQIKIEDFRPPETAKKLFNEIFPHVIDNGVWSGELPIQHEDGHQFPTSNVITLILNKEGKPIGLGTIARDITESKAYAAELESRNEELDAFAGTVAHDLRTPLTPIVGFADALKRFYGPKLDDQAIRFIDQISNNAHRMSDIIDALLLLAQLRHASPEITPIDMQAITTDILDRSHHLIEEYDATIEQPEQWPSALGYTPWIKEVWANYISNAMKYGGRPPIVTLSADKLPNGHIRYCVHDNGTGITPENQAKLFTPFTRLEETGEIEGHGLGLSIVKRIIDKLHGEVGVASTLGQGSVFWFTLPPLPPNTPPTTDDHAPTA